MIDAVTKIDLLPCPYCGHDAAEVTTAQELEDCENFEDYETCPALKISEECPYVKVVCNVNRGGCGASTGYAWDAEQAVKKWNKRARIESEIPTGGGCNE